MPGAVEYLQEWTSHCLWALIPIVYHPHNENIFFLTANWNFPCCSLYPLPLVYSYVPLRSIHLHLFLLPLMRQLERAMRSACAFGNAAQDVVGLLGCQASYSISLPCTP